MDVTYTGVAVKSREEAFVTAIIDEYADQSPDHCLVLRFYQGQFKRLLLDHAVVAVAFDATAASVSFVAPDGRVSTADASGVRTEVIDDGDDGPSSLVTVRDAAVIGGNLYVCGMARFVYRRQASGPWVRRDRGLFVPRDQRTTGAGLYAIAGRAEDDIVSVGQYGEIWCFNGSEWRQDASPTNVALTRSLMTSDGRVVAAGLAGTVLQGRRGAWETVTNSLTKQDFWGLTHFQDGVYLSGDRGLYKIEHGELTKVDMGLGNDLTTAYLDGRDGMLWSVGEKNLAISPDGSSWSRVADPVAGS